MYITPWFQNIITSFLGGQALPAAATVEFGLSSTDPATAYTEIAKTAVVFKHSKTGLISNENQIVLPITTEATAAYAVIIINGNVALSAALVPALILPANETVLYAAESILFGSGGHIDKMFSALLVNWLRGSAPTPPSAVFLELLRDDGTTPRTTDGYAPASFTPVLPFLRTDGKYTIENAEDVLFPLAKTTAWGNITAISLTNGMGTRYITTQLSIPKLVTIGTSVGFPNNSIVWEIG